MRKITIARMCFNCNNKKKSSKNFISSSIKNKSIYKNLISHVSSTKNVIIFLKDESLFHNAKRTLQKMPK